MLTPKQERFVEEYLVDFNATQAAVRAGYSAKTAEQRGPRLLGNVGFAAAIEAAQQKRSERTGITSDRVLAEYAKIGFSDMRQYMAWGPDGVVLKLSTQLTNESAAAVAEVVQTVTEHGGILRAKLHEKRAALDSLARHLGMFKDKVELDVDPAVFERVRDALIRLTAGHRLAANRSDVGGSRAHSVTTERVLTFWVPLADSTRR